MEKEVLKLITAIRESFDDSVKVYTQGGCFRFYLILKSVFPDAAAYYDMDHIITKIGDKYYDINGEYTDLKNYLPLTDYPNSLKQAHKWKYRP